MPKRGDDEYNSAAISQKVYSDEYMYKVMHEERELIV